jgi:hypothetical protein
MTTIQLAELTKNEVRSLSGQERGFTARSHFQLDELDKAAGPIIVSVPDDVDSISPSFLRGMFSLSIVALGVSAFFSHYVFDAKPQILKQVNRAVHSTMLDNDHLFT